jgi:hypothetical protein
MGNGSGKGSLSPEFLSSSKRFSEAELQDIKKLFISLAYQSRSHGEFVIASVFQAHYGIHGALGGRLFDLVTQSREEKHLYYEDLVIAKALYEKGSPEEMDEFMYQLMDLTGNAHIQRAEIEAVLLSILETVLSPKDAVPDASLPEESLQAFLNAASFTDEVEGDDGPFMSSQNFQKWCTLVPSIKKFLATLLKSPAPGVLNTQPFILYICFRDYYSRTHDSALSCTLSNVDNVGVWWGPFRDGGSSSAISSCTTRYKS